MGLHAEGEREPVAVIGLGCRFPAASGPRALWRLLETGSDSVGTLPRDRFHPQPVTSGREVRGGFLDQIDRFDAQFFGISPREAERLDPQQRLLLEVTWEALEDAGLVISRLEGSRTGVFTGLWITDYEARMLAEADQVDFHMTTGSGRYTASGRVSHILGLRGPSMTIDTACSSSLVAVHLACQSLWSGEVETAIAAGANVILEPHITAAYSRAGMLSTDGRCKFGDATADGYVRSEGVGVVVLKPLSLARRDGDPIRAVILGSAVNNDGHTGGSLGTPGRGGQEELLRTAYLRARVEPARVAYVEAHGTGTRAGDPVELGALGAVVGAGRPAGQPCLVGSVKTNIGHTEGAAGIAGLIKVVLSLQHRIIPASLHCATPTPEVAWRELNLSIPSEAVRWPDGERPLAGVSSFGIGGTNAHVVLAAHEESAADVVSPAPEIVLAVSARTPQALHEQARQYASYLRDPLSPPLGDIAFTAMIRRTHHEHRLALVGRHRLAMAEQLDSYLAAGTAAGLVEGHVTEQPRVAFVFPGQGSQWVGMGLRLLETASAFRDAIKRCDLALGPLADGGSLLDELAAGPNARLDRIDVVQPLLFAIQVALAAQWSTWGARPAAVVGHSMGEIAAAHVAGALTLDDAALIITARSRLLRGISGRGAMAVVELSAEDAAARLRGNEDRLSIAVCNSDRSTVVAGDVSALEVLLEQLERDGVFCRRINVDVASHSPQVDPLTRALAREIGRVRPGPARVTMYSTVTGAPIDGTRLDQHYWIQNLRETVQFGAAVRRLLADGFDSFVEISPHPVLLPAIGQSVPATRRIISLPSMRRDESERAVMLESLASLWAFGSSVSWERLFPGGRHPVDLPLYPWQHERFWFERAPRERERSSSATDRTTESLLPGRRRDIADMPGRITWEAELDGDSLGGRLEHRLDGVRMLPAAAVLATMIAAARETASPAEFVTDVEFQRPILLPAPGSRLQLQTVFTPLEENGARVAVYTRADDGPWILHAAARLPGSAQSGPAADPESSTRMQRLDRGGVDGGAFYEGLGRLGAEISEALRGIRSLDRRSGDVLASIADHEALGAGAGDVVRLATALDVCFQLPAADGEHDGALAVGMPVTIEEVRLQRCPDVVVAHALRRGDRPEWDVRLLDTSGVPAVELKGLRIHDVTRSRAGHLYEIRWSASTAARETKAEPGTWIVLANSRGIAAGLQRRLEAERAVAVVLDRESGWERLLADRLAAGDCRGVIDLRGIDGADELSAIAPPTPGACRDALSTLRALLTLRSERLPRLWLVTKGSQSVGAGSARAPLASALWGLGRVLIQEHPELRARLVDLDPAADLEQDVRDLVAELNRSAGSDDTPEIAYRGGSRYTAQLVRSPGRDDEGGAGVRDNATYVVTGGLGALGSRVARWLAEQGGRHLVLLSRTPMAPRADWPRLDRETAARAATIREIEARGARVHHAAVDLADLPALGAVLEGLRREGWPPIHGVVHTAAVIDDQLLRNLDGPALDRVWRGKAVGAWWLHRLLEKEPLDFFVLFSSLGSLLGQPGQGSYAAANAFLDGLAHLRAANGLPATSINWGAWENLGLAATTGGREVIGELRRMGIAPLAPDRALDLLARAIAVGRPQVAAFAVDDGTGDNPSAPRARPTMLASVLTDARPRAGTVLTTLASELRGLPEDERHARVERLVCERLGSVLKVAPGRIERRKPFGTIGVDSLIALEFRRHLEAALGLVLPATMVFNHPTVADLVSYLSAQITPATASSGAGPDVATPTDSGARRIEQLGALSDADAVQALRAARRPTRG